MSATAATTQLNANTDGPILLCVPPAGMGTHIFRGWARTLGRTVRLVGVETGWRTPAGSTQTLAEVVAGEAAGYGRPVSIFGHSAGCYLALHIALELRPESGGSETVVLAAPPRDAESLQAWNSRTDADMFHDLISFGQVQRSAAANSATVRRVVGRVREDLAVAAEGAAALAAADPTEVSHLQVDVWWGSGDPANSHRSTPSNVLGARIRRTSTFDGGHFFPFDRRSRAPNVLERELHRYRPSRSGVVQPVGQADRPRLRSGGGDRGQDVQFGGPPRRQHGSYNTERATEK